MEGVAFHGRLRKGLQKHNRLGCRRRCSGWPGRGVSLVTEWPIAFGFCEQGSIVVGGLRDGLGGVEREAEVAFWVAPGILRFAWLLMAVVGGESGAEFKGAG